MIKERQQQTAQVQEVRTWLASSDSAHISQAQREWAKVTCDLIEAGSQSLENGELLKRFQNLMKF